MSTPLPTTVPDPLTCADGQRVGTVEAWGGRRSEILELFRSHVYGRSPKDSGDVSCEVLEEASGALGGTALRRQVAIDIAGNGRPLRIHLLMYLPISAENAPAPVFACLNFLGNHTVHADPAIIETVPGLPREVMPPGRHDRGGSSSRYPVEQMIARGYGLATVSYGDIDPDEDDGFANGIHPLFDPPGERAADAWGSVGGWAFGLSRIMDYLQEDAQVDGSRVAVLGHSRLGKTSLWASAQDERFALVVSNDSGCTGAAYARRKMGETVAAINTQFPHWFCQNYRQYNDREEELPIDQHMLLALIAPRPLYVASAVDDSWADPEGEFLSCVGATPVYELHGLQGVQQSTMPELEQPLLEGRIGYHIRTGKHGLTAYDWKQFMDFADREMT